MSGGRSLAIGIFASVEDFLPCDKSSEDRGRCFGAAADVRAKVRKK
jgi:hypothetical protein